jgi:hypothetical protein
MSSTTFVTVTLDEIQGRHEQHWFSALETLEVPAENDGTESRISPVMPYARAYRAYTDHLEDCEGCAEGTLWDQCPEGDWLSGLAADAMAAQEDLALQN